MKVLLVTGSAPPMRCGVGDYTMRLAKALAVRPDVSAVTVLTSSAAGTLREEEGVQLLPVIQSWGIGGLCAVIRALRRASSDVVHIQYPTQGYGRHFLPALLPLAARLTGARVVQTWHEPVSLRMTHRLGVQLLAHSEIVVVRHDYPKLLHWLTRALLKHRRFHYISGASALPAAHLSGPERESHRQLLLRGQSRLVVYLGFIYEHKGVDLLFDVADPATDHLVIAGEFGPDLDYRRLVEGSASGRWAGKVTFPGFLPAEGAANLLNVADAVVLPFRLGAGDWNSSLHAAIANGAYVVTTSLEHHGYDAERRIAFVPVGDVPAMRSALSMASVRQGELVEGRSETGWDEIAAKHVAIYLGTSPTLQSEARVAA